jgi:MoaA/NifB/PqqE/SkfB family radical SAM enzyme
MRETPEPREGACALAPGSGADAAALRNLEVAEGSAYLLSRPEALGIESTTQCNLRCVMCPQRTMLAEGTPRAHMSTEVFDAASAFFPVAKIFFTGFGEALLHPMFIPMMERMTRQAAQVEFFTNGILLTPEVSERLVGMGTWEVEVSFDARDPRLFKAIRGCDIETVLANTRALIAARRRSGARRPLVLLSFVLMRSNLPEMSAVAELAADLGADGVTYSQLKCSTPDVTEFFEREGQVFNARCHGVL